MSTIEDAYQFSLKSFEIKKRGGGCGGKTSGWSYGGKSEDQNKTKRPIRILN